MKSVLTFTASYWASVFFLAIGLGIYGCKDTASVSNDVQIPLANLTVTPGTLQPAFSSNTTSYTVETPTAATSITVTAAPRDNTTTMTINGIATAPGQERSVPLGPPGSTIKIQITLASQTGGESGYTLTVTRPLSSDNDLKTLTSTPGSLNPSFTSDRLTYNIDVTTNVSNVTIAATKSDPNAVMQIGTVPIPAGTASGQANIQLGAPGTPTPVSIDVTAPNGSRKTYNITINRLLSDDNNLRTLQVTSGSLNPRFAPGTLQYAVNVATDVTQVTVTATKSDPAAVISGNLPNEGQATIPLDGPGISKDISIAVTAPKGNSKTYVITVTRLLSNDNNLRTLQVAPGTLSPQFAAGTPNYTVDVATEITQVTITATKSDPAAVISGDVPNEGQATIPLTGAGTKKVISITVTAPNGNDKTYTVSVNRAAPSNNSNLSALSINTGSLEPAFAQDTLGYTVTIGFLAGSVTITATKSDPNAVMSALGSVIAAAGVSTGTVTVSAGFGPNPPVEIRVTAQDGVTIKSYTVTVSRSLS